jgi:hypothetical protein
MILFRIVLCKHSKSTRMSRSLFMIKWPQKFVGPSPTVKLLKANVFRRLSTWRPYKNTVIRALHILRDEGLLDFTRGRGARVVGTPQRGAVMTRIEELLVFARTQGYRREEVVALIQSRG